jgi:hypothetical protein
VKLLPWSDRLPGDVFLAYAGGLVGGAIELFERKLHPDYPDDQPVPTHAGLIGFDDTVIEAWLSISEDSVCSVNPCAKYDGVPVEIWRPWSPLPQDAGPASVNNIYEAAIDTYISQEIGWKYGWSNLLGFEYKALVKMLTGKNCANPIEVSDVCSQGVGIYLGKYLAPLVKPALDWAAAIAYDDLLIRNFDPLAARIAFMAHT